MKAIGATRFLPVSDPGCLVKFEMEKPTPQARDLLVRIMAVAVNPVDTKIRASLGETTHKPPRVLGWDAAGVVEALGSDVTGFELGDEVFYSGDIGRAGCNAEYQTVDFRLVGHKPASWTFEDAAALPLVVLTAWELLFERMGVDPDGRDSGKSLLIINGAGGVGSALIPLAKQAGLKIVATASREETTSWCHALGADQVINHRSPLRPQVEILKIKDFPYIANLFSTDAYWDTTADLIAPFGTLGLIVEPKEKLHIGDPLKAKCVRIAWEFMAARAKYQSPDLHLQGQCLETLSTRCEADLFPKLQTRTFDELSVANLRTAHAAMETGKAYGKWVFRCQPA